MKVLTIILAAFLFVEPRLTAQEVADPLCVAVEKVPIPEADLPPPGVNTKDCDPLELVSRPGHPVDLRAVRYCAYNARDGKVDGDTGNSISGDAGLVMIYAGGKGVAPNIPLAERFACEIPNDYDNNGTDVANMLEAKRKEGATRIDFDICEQAGRLLGMSCISRDQIRVGDEVALAEKRFNTGDVRQQAAFNRLQATRKAYLDAHEAEYGLGDSGAAQAAMAEDIELDHNWAQTLDRLSEGKLPQYTDEEFRKADLDLNETYSKAIAGTTNCAPYECYLAAEKLREIERAWIAYRDAWVAYAALRWPATPADAWRTLVTLERTKDLHDL